MARPSTSVRDTIPALPAGHGQRILVGLDPGTLVVGYGAIVVRGAKARLLAAGTLRAPRRLLPPQRLAWLRGELDLLLERLRPSAVAVESGFSGRNPATALRTGEGRGVALASAASACERVIELTPAEIKKALVGDGQADKDRVAAMVAEVLSLAATPASRDLTDALAVALTLHARDRFSSKVLSPRP